MSTFLVLQTAVTSAPSALAICTANVPTPPDAPLIRTADPFACARPTAYPSRHTSPPGSTRLRESVPAPRRPQAPACRSLEARRHRASRICLGPPPSSSRPAVDGQDDVSGLLPRLHVSGRLDHLLERVAPIDDRAGLPCLDEFLQEEDILLRELRYRERHPLVTDPPGQQGQQGDVPHEAEVGCEVDPARLQRASTASERVLADRVEDDVVHLAVLGEVLLQVVDELVCSERSHELDVLRVAHRGDVGAEVRGELHAGSSDGSGGAVYEDALPLAEIRPPQLRQRLDRAVA